MADRVIETAQLILRPITTRDVEMLHQIWIEPEVREYLWDGEIITTDRVRSLVDTSLQSFKEKGFGLWGIWLRQMNSLIGFCGFWLFHDPPKLELLYGVSSAHWHRGLATEAARAMLNYGFGVLSFDRIEASTDVANLASIRVLEKAGMTFWKREITNGLDTIYYAISREDQRSQFSEGGDRAKD